MDRVQSRGRAARAQRRPPVVLLHAAVGIYVKIYVKIDVMDR